MMSGSLHPFDIEIIHGAVTIAARLVRDNQRQPGWRRSSAAPLMDVASTTPDVTYAQIPREQGADIAIEDVAGGAGAYYYEPGKYAFGIGVATEGGLVYPGPEITATTVVPSTEAAENISANSVAAATVVTVGTHTFQTGDTVTIAGSNSTPSIDGAHVITRISTTQFSIPVTVTNAGSAGTATLTGLGSLNGAVSCWLQYNGVDFIAAGAHVYRWDSTNTRWQRIHLAPGGETYNAGATYSEPPATITDMTWFRSAAGTDRLLIAFGNQSNPYAFTVQTLSNIATGTVTQWSQPNATTDPYSSDPWYYPKYWAKKELGLTATSVLGTVDPDVIYASDQPCSVTATWDTGTRVGQAGTGAEFTSLITAPVTGEVLVGKKEGLRTFDATDDPLMAFGPIPVSNGDGLANFIWPASVGGSVYYPVGDYDILEYAGGEITAGFGVALAGPRIPEMQKPIVSLASDGINMLYAALSGSEGYIMRGLPQADEKFHWHGAYIAAGFAIGRMWISSHPAAPTAVEREQYLKICPTASPYLPYRALIPRVDLQTATSAQAKFRTSGSIRFGYMVAGLVHQKKVLSHSTLTGINLDANNRWLLQYRKDDDTSFTSVGSSFTSNGQKIYYASQLAGVRFEIQVSYTGAANTSKPAIEAIVSRIHRRPVRLNTFEITIHAETGQVTGMGADGLVSADQMCTELENAKNSWTIPLLKDHQSGESWAVDILSVNEQWLQDTSGPGRTRVFILRMQELDTIDNQRVQSATGG